MRRASLLLRELSLRADMDFPWTCNSKGHSAHPPRECSISFAAANGPLQPIAYLTRTFVVPRGLTSVLSLWRSQACHSGLLALPLRRVTLAWPGRSAESIANYRIRRMRNFRLVFLRESK